MRVLTYLVEVEPLKGGGLFLYVPALPGCIAWGNSLESTLTRARHAILGVVDGMVLDDVLEPDDYKIALCMRLGTATLDVVKKAPVLAPTLPRDLIDRLTQSGFEEVKRGKGVVTIRGRHNSGNTLVFRKGRRLRRRL